MSAVVFVPGLNCTAELFEPQITALRALGRSIAVADHASDGSIEAIADRLLAAAPARFSLCGLSMGGYVALEVMARAPERVERLALLDTRASPDTDEDAERRARLIAVAEGGRFLDIHAALWPRLVHSSRVGDVALEAVVRRMMVETGADRFVRQQYAVLRRRDARAWLSAITCPTLVLVGDADIVTPPAMAEEMASSIVDARLFVVPDCGHLSTLERPDVVTAALLEWLRL